MKHFLAGIACVAALALAGCGTLASGAASVAATVAGPSPTQATTLGQAEQLATVATDLTKAYVDTASLSLAQLQQINALNDGLHTAITSLETANSQGQALSFAAFNAALAAFNSYKATLPQPVT